jgi:hypothetical protein
MNWTDKSKTAKQKYQQFHDDFLLSKRKPTSNKAINTPSAIAKIIIRT